MIPRTIAATAHGRYLIEPPSTPGPAPILIGFHGYAEPAEVALDRLVAIAPDGDWLVVAIQGLHRFYRGRSEDVVASWMTRQDRELAIADNIQYVQAVVGAIGREWQVRDRLVFAGFSQGVAMAFRAACSSSVPASVIACGGDVPPDVAPVLARIRSVLIGRGTGDDWYTQAKMDADVARLNAAGVGTRSLLFDGGHEWAPPFAEAAAEFLGSQR
jgi:poly(3-hydroxybutyrate) depolymerase